MLTQEAVARPKAGRSQDWGLRGASLLYLLLMIVIPILVIVQDGFREGLGEFQRQIALPAARHAILLTLWTSALMTVINALAGLATAYVLVRYRFPGKSLLNALVDLPLSIPTLVTGVMLVILFGPQASLGAFLDQRLGFQVIYAPPGIVLALLFVTFPFVVRTLQPVLMDLDREQEDAAATLGASPWTIFRRVTFPALALPWLGGSLLSFARAVGEFGSVVIVAGNIPLRSQTAAVYVWGAVESENRLGASAVSIALLALAFVMMLITSRLQRRWQRAG